MLHKYFLIPICLCGLFTILQGQSDTKVKNPYLSIPVVDLDKETHRQIIVDKEKGQYLGHVTTVLLEDNKTMIAVYPKGHGKGGIVMKHSKDAGKTWSARLPTPKSWETSKEVPTIHRVVDANGKKRLIMFSGLYPTRMAVSENDGKTWSGLNPVGDWGGIVVMGAFTELKTGKGHYMAFFHDDGRFFTENGADFYKKDREQHTSALFTFYKTISTDGGLTWSFPETIYKSREIHICEPGIIRSPDGKQLAILLRENNRRENSQIIFSDDEGKTWTNPKPLPNSLTGDRHTLKYAHDGRLIAVIRDNSSDRKVFSDMARNLKVSNLDSLAKAAGMASPTEGDWVCWVGTYDDLVKGTEGQYRIRLKDNKSGWDCCYQGVELLPNGTFVTTTYGHWDSGESPHILSVRFKLKEMDKRIKKIKDQ